MVENAVTSVEVVCSLQTQDQHCANGDLYRLRREGLLREVEIIVDRIVTMRPVTDGAEAQRERD